MTVHESSGPGCGLPSGRRAGRNEFRQLVRDALACAAREGWHEIILSDASFEDWPLGEREVVASLRAWSKSGRKLVMLARHYDDVVRRHARFVAWRQAWTHIIECRGLRAADPLDLPSALWSPAWAMRRLEPEDCTVVCGPEPERRLALRQTLDEWLKRSAPSFPASTLGL